jgi:Tfp pilus assembly protein PilX
MSFNFSFPKCRQAHSMKNCSDFNRSQCGVATLTITVIVLVIVTLMVAYATKVGVLDQRMAGNEVRYKEAFALAEAGLDFATQKFNSAFKLSYDGTQAATSLTTILANSQVASATEADGTSPESGEGSFTVAITPTSICFPVPTPPATCATSPTSIPIYSFVSTGVGADGTGTATVQRQITMSHAMGGKAPDVPIIVSGAVGTGGNFNIVANPNAAGPGIPVSVWSNDDITVSSSSATCHIQYYDGNNAQCSNPSGNQENISKGTNPASALTSHSASMPDLLPHDPNFPSDLFNFLFGLPRTDWATKKMEAEMNGQAVSSCTPIVNSGVSAGNSYTLWWITGNCAFSGGDEIGSDDKPVILVIDDGALQTNGNVKIHGIVYLFNNPSNGATPSAALNGTTEIQGSFISDVGGTAMQGSYSVVYDPNVIDSFVNGSGSNFSIGYVPGSWRDF